MFHYVIDNFAQQAAGITITFLNGHKIYLYNDSRDKMEIDDVGEQYLSIKSDTHTTLYPFSSILKIDFLW